MRLLLHIDSSYEIGYFRISPCSFIERNARISDDWNVVKFCIRSRVVQLNCGINIDVLNKNKGLEQIRYDKKVQIHVCVNILRTKMKLQMVGVSVTISVKIKLL
jgi:hypothetical protein